MYRGVGIERERDRELLGLCFCVSWSPVDTFALHSSIAARCPRVCREGPGTSCRTCPRTLWHSRPGFLHTESSSPGSLCTSHNWNLMGWQTDRKSEPCSLCTSHSRYQMGWQTDRKTEPGSLCISYSRTRWAGKQEN